MIMAHIIVDGVQKQIEAVISVKVGHLHADDTRDVTAMVKLAGGGYAKKTWLMKNLEAIRFVRQLRMLQAKMR